MDNFATKCQKNISRWTIRYGRAYDNRIRAEVRGEESADFRNQENHCVDMVAKWAQIQRTGEA